MAPRVVRKTRDSKGPTREAVITGALEIIDAEGEDALSMRRLGLALGCDPMSLYRHASTKAALLDAVAESVMSGIEIDIADPDWPGQLRHFARQFRAIALTHPNVVPLLVTRPLATPMALWPLGTLRPMEAVLELLRRAGFTEADALRVYRLVYGSTQGHILNELQKIVADDDETDDVLRLGLQRLPIREFPRIRELASVLSRYDGAEELERRLDIMISGLQVELRPTNPAIT